jgi:hypothetical protein
MDFYVLLSNSDGISVVTDKSVARLLYVLGFVHVFSNELCTKGGNCLYVYFEVLIMLCEVHKVEAIRMLVSEGACHHSDTY